MRIAKTHRFLTAASFTILAFLPALTAPTVHATPITYSAQGTGVSGTLNGTSFSDLIIVITGTGDTTGVSSNGAGILTNTLTSASFSLFTSGLTLYATGTFTDSIVVRDYSGVSSAGFTDLTVNQNILLVGNAVFATYDLTTAIGPLIGTAAEDGNTLFATTAGNLTLPNSPATSGVFRADLSTSVPEPSSVLLLGSSLAGLLGLKLRRDRS